MSTNKCISYFLFLFFVLVPSFKRNARHLYAASSSPLSIFAYLFILPIFFMIFENLFWGCYAKKYSLIFYKIVFVPVLRKFYGFFPSFWLYFGFSLWFRGCQCLKSNWEPCPPTRTLMNPLRRQHIERRHSCKTMPKSGLYLNNWKTLVGVVIFFFAQGKGGWCHCGAVSYLLFIK